MLIEPVWVNVRDPIERIFALLARNFTGWSDQVENCLIDARKVLGRNLRTVIAISLRPIRGLWST